MLRAPHWKALGAVAFQVQVGRGYDGEMRSKNLLHLGVDVSVISWVPEGLRGLETAGSQ